MQKETVESKEHAFQILGDIGEQLKAAVNDSKSVEKINLKVDGNLLEEKELTLNVDPKETTKVRVNLPKECTMGAYVHCYLLDTTGYAVAQKQLEIPAQIVKKHIHYLLGQAYLKLPVKNVVYH